MALELYAWPRSSASRITWALAELDVPYRYIEQAPCGLSLDGWPNVSAWLQRCTSRPARQQAR